MVPSQIGTSQFRDVFSNAIQSRLPSWCRRGNSSKRNLRRWTPPALHPLTLLLAIASSIALIAVLQTLLLRSQHNSGILFAPSIAALPLRRTFLYQYFPTILAVVYSIFWSWIDLETKRLEPYFQLSKAEGALGKDSLLLCYPTRFLPSVPVRSFKERHWRVFAASVALLLVSWGLVPFQAGIFSVKNVQRSFDTGFEVSTGFMPASKQKDGLTLSFAQSTYGIVALGEVMPPFMTREYALAPLRRVGALGDELNQESAMNWTAPTTLYSVDLDCAPAIQMPDDPQWSANSTTGCRMLTGLSGDQIQDATAFSPGSVKEYSAMYAGFGNLGFATYYIDSCPSGKNHTFYAAFTRNKAKSEDPANNVTAIFCEPKYYAQDVLATVQLDSKRPVKLEESGPKRSLPSELFDSTWFEGTLNGGSSGIEVRGDHLPGLILPNYYQQMLDTNLTYPPGGASIMALATLVDGRPLNDYLGAQALTDSYEKAYRLMFARIMVDILGTDFNSTKLQQGATSVLTDALLLVPVFVYIVEGILSVVTIAAIVMLFLSVSHTPALLSNPSSIASLMSLVSDNEALLRTFRDLDCCTDVELDRIISQRKYRLVCDDTQHGIMDITPTSFTEGSFPSLSAPSTKSIDRPVKPLETRAFILLPFIFLLVIIAATLAVLFVKGRAYGLALPSNNKIVTNLLLNYLPTAIATLIEPIWVLINRLMCLLQPLETLRRHDAKAKDSIDLKYTSCPPQLVLLTALRAKHFMLVLICGMALLANLLAVALAGIFNQEALNLPTLQTFEQPYQARFVAINGSSGPIREAFAGSTVYSGAYRGGEGRDQFLVAESNLTRGTLLPAWVDQEKFYLPFIRSQTWPGLNQESEATTLSLGADIDCQTVAPADYELGSDAETLYRTISLSGPATTRDGITTRCSNVPWTYNAKRSALFRKAASVCSTVPLATEYIFIMQAASVSASQMEKETCNGLAVLGWGRMATNSCNETQTATSEAESASFIACRPRIVQGKASVRVNSDGRLLRPATHRQPDRDLSLSDVGQSFSNDPVEMIAQSNRFIFQAVNDDWHNDSLASDSFHYFLRRAANSTRFLDPHATLPTLADVQDPVRKAYSNLFAIWLGINSHLLLMRSTDPATETTNGLVFNKHERVLVSTPLFAIAQAILTTYVIVAVLTYYHRPGIWLARMPNSMASVIALFAASTAVQDLERTAHLSRRDRRRQLEHRGARYAYGSYIGVDGGVHTGVEKVPFVIRRSLTAKKSK